MIQETARLCKVLLGDDCMEMPMTTALEQVTQPSRLNGHYPNGATNSAEALLVDRFPYGWRTIAQVQPDGSIDYMDIPLTQADFFDPQVGDHLVQSDAHLKLVLSLVGRFEQHYLHDPTVGVFGDLKMLWGIPGEKEPAPDVAIVFNLKDKEKPRSSFDVVKEGTLPALVVEIVSPQYPGDDTTKVDIYTRVGIPEYIIIDPHFEKRDGEIELTGYRLLNGRRHKIRPDARGRLLSETTQIWFELDAKKRKLHLVDAITGQRLLTHAEERQRAEAERQRAERAEQRAAAAEAEVARLRSLMASQG
ncbi:MAG: Uma2 family endonuclease [Caldilinea sp. CFX5]|nr:Uma2 family endonuclease [Caldilinea sp. CFX5]